MVPRVLIVEHEPVVALDLEDVIREAGYQVAGVASSGGEALAWIRSPGLDLILIDENLPGQPGAGEIIEQFGNDSKVAVVVLSSYPSANARGRFRGAREARRLVKPFSLHDLLSALHQSAAAAA